jgi:hypothetical protein
MAYTICLLRGDLSQQLKVLDALEARLLKSVFTAKLTPAMDAKGNLTIIVKPVRLRQGKAYCGQHPGSCLVNPFFGPTKKPVAKWLEWDDWVKFHGLVNAVLNRLRIHADVWSTPTDVRGKMHIRKDMSPRIKWEWTESFTKFGTPIRIWNQGDESQFKRMS